jgi:hypothetical protein
VHAQLHERLGVTARRLRGSAALAALLLGAVGGVGVAAGRSAHIANVNDVVPKFSIYFNYNVVRKTLQLTKLSLKPFYRRVELLPSGGCFGCTGSGQFTGAKVTGDTITESVTNGSRYLGARAGFVEVITSPDEIGRYKVYALDTRSSPPVPVVLKEGCTPANLQISNDQAFDYKSLPTVPCTAQVARGDHIKLSSPLELSSTKSLHASVSGHSTGPQWLAVFEASSPGCGVNALAESLRTTRVFQVHVPDGRFRVNFRTPPASRPGHFCAYLQTGGRTRVTALHGALLADGRLSATTASYFVAGDALTITSATAATQGQHLPVTLSGVTHLRTELYYFAPDSPCAGTAEAEYGIDPHVLEFTERPGPIHEQVTLGVSPNAPATVYECVYLLYGSPSQRAPVGPTLVGAAASVAVSPAGTPFTPLPAVSPSPGSGGRS